MQRVPFTFFHSAGITFCWIVQLKMTDNGKARASDPSLSRRDGIPSTPVAFFDFNSLRALRTSDTVIFRGLNFYGRSISGSHLKNDRALDRWVDLKSSAQETKKRLKMLHLSFASFAVRAAAPLLLEPFPSSCFRFFHVQRESSFVSRSCSLKYLCFSFLSFKVTTLRKRFSRKSSSGVQ